VDIERRADLGRVRPFLRHPGPCGPLYSVPSAAAEGSTVAAGKAADSAAVEQIPFIRVLLEKSELMVVSSWWVLHRAWLSLLQNDRGPAG